MPELPEVQTVVNGLNHVARDKSISELKVHWSGYIAGIDPVELGRVLKGQRFIEARRRGKYIIIELDKSFLILHLRMTGKVLNLDHYASIDKHTHAEIHFEGGLRIGLSDVRKFGRLEYVPRNMIDQRLAKIDLGPEPLEDEFSAETLHERISKSARPIKNILLDQKVVAGLGNIYVCEILFLSGISPQRHGADLNRNEVEKIVEHTKEILQFAIDKGGSSIRDYVNVDGKTGEMQKHFDVYGREGELCYRCDTELTKIKQAGRSSFFCPSCQK